MFPNNLFKIRSFLRYQNFSTLITKKKPPAITLKTKFSSLKEITGNSLSSPIAINSPRNFIHLICLRRAAIKRLAWFSVTSYIPVSSFVTLLSVIYDTRCMSPISNRKKPKKKYNPKELQKLTGAQIWILWQEARYLSAYVTRFRIWQNRFKTFIVGVLAGSAGKRIAPVCKLI